MVSDPGVGYPCGPGIPGNNNMGMSEDLLAKFVRKLSILLETVAVRTAICQGQTSLLLRSGSVVLFRTVLELELHRGLATDMVHPGAYGTVCRNETSKFRM